MIHTRFLFYGSLNDFLPAPQRHQVIDQALAEHAAVKHPIESLGVPHPEVEAILVNKQPVDLEYQLQDGDFVEVYPQDMPRTAGRLHPAAAAHHAPDPLRGRHPPGPAGSLSAHAGLRHPLPQRLRRPPACRHCRRRGARAAVRATAACSSTRASSTASAHARSIRTGSSSPCSSAIGWAARYSRGGAASTATACSRMSRRAQSWIGWSPRQSCITTSSNSATPAGESTGRAHTLTGWQLFVEEVRRQIEA